MFIQEVIVENFMSYEYARIPLKPGVNVVCGPNGAGKSSILLGISIALGQSYTERSKRLSDLIRWGKDQARVTLILDNSRRRGRRPVRRKARDQIFLTRVLRRDGTYWRELDNKVATKHEVDRVLAKFGVNPENMLIIMHQNMVQQFTVLSPQEKLRIVEAAVGFESYRRNVSDAHRKLNRILSEEDSVGKLLESAEQTLTYWREQYDRYQQKKQLSIKRQFLERELAWAQVAKIEKSASKVRAQIQKEQVENTRIENETKKVDAMIIELEEKLKHRKVDRQKLLRQRLGLEKERTEQVVRLNISDQTLKETRSWLELHRRLIKESTIKIKQLEDVTHTSELNPESQVAAIKEACEQIEDAWVQRLNLKCENLKQTVKNSRRQLAKLETQIPIVDSNIKNADQDIEEAIDITLNNKIRSALLRFKMESLVKAIAKLNLELKRVRNEIEKETKRAENIGLRIVVVKSIEEILDEIRLTDGHIAALADVTEDIERMYESYSKLYLELKEKTRIVAENREKALVEVRIRMEAWHTVLENLLKNVNFQYHKILSNAQANGKVRLFNEQDIDAAGLQIFVGFRGANPVPLDAYTQSGGERSTATMSFLLALQQHVRSPFRAVDEYDIHMDPKNREIIAKILVSSVSGLETQYLAITPSQISFNEKEANIITVQNIEGASLVKQLV